MKRLVASLIAAACFFGCYGRPRITHSGDLNIAAYGLRPNVPAVVSFSAVWCHPCREEINGLNQANEEFGSQIQIKGLLVEGEVKGSPVEPGDVDKFLSLSGAKPTYAIGIDPNWNLFDRLRAPNGRAIPTILFINAQGEVLQIIQQGLDYETELRPLLVALASGIVLPQPTPVPTPPPDDGQTLVLPMDQYLARAEVASNPGLVANVTAAWQQGLTKYSFTTDEMPLNSGSMTFQWNDKTSLDTPSFCAWKAITNVSICSLKVFFNSDGGYKSSTGVCKPK